MEKSEIAIDIDNETVIDKKNEIIIPANTIRIEHNAFKNSNAKTISFKSSNTLKIINDEAFYGCSSIEGIILPESVVKIGNRAFYGCKNLRYIYIPNSAVDIGKDILGNCNDKILVFGNANTEAEEVAKQYELAIRPLNDNDIRSINKIIEENKKLKKKTFNIFDEKIVCYNSLPLYLKTINYYNDIKNSLYKKYISIILNVTIKRIKNDVEESINMFYREIDSLLDRLANKGIFISTEKIAKEIYYLYTTILKFNELIINAYYQQKKVDIEDIKNKETEMINEAENNITGLSYGVIGSPIDMIAYSIDDNRARKRQYEEEYEKLNKKISTYRNLKLNETDKSFCEFVNQLQPDIQKVINKYMDALCNIEITLLTKFGLLDEHVADGLDIIRSENIMSSIKNDKENHSISIALALKYNPMNIKAYTYAKEHQYESSDLQKLIQFLNLQEKVDLIIKTERERKEELEFEKYKNSVSKCLSANEGVRFIKDTTSPSDTLKIKAGLQVLAQSNYNRIIKSCRPTADIINEIANGTKNIHDYCVSELDYIINEETWTYFTENSVNPVPHPSDNNGDLPVSLARESIIALMEKRINKKIQETEKKYQQALTISKSATTGEDFDLVLKSLESIKGYKNSAQKYEEIKIEKEYLDKKDEDAIIRYLTICMLFFLAATAFWCGFILDNNAVWYTISILAFIGGCVASGYRIRYLRNLSNDYKAKKRNLNFMSH